MRKIVKKLSAVALCTVFASMQIASAAIETGLNNAVINKVDGGFKDIVTDDNKATLNFNGNSHVNWNTLNVGSNETLNFNAVDGAKGLTIINTVNDGMTKVYGAINSNEGIARLIISNPNGLLFDGASVTSAGDLMLTTQPIDVKLSGNDISYTSKVGTQALKGIEIKNNSNFTVGGEFSLYTPSAQIVNSAIKGNLKLVTNDGQTFLVYPVADNAERQVAVKMEAVSVNGDVYILSGKEIVEISKGGTISGDLKIVSDGNVSLNSGLEIQDNGKVKFNYDNNGPQLVVNGNLKVDNDGRIAYLRNAKVDKNVEMTNSGGFLEVSDVKVGQNVTLTTTNVSNKNVRHFVHVVGDNEIDGNLTVKSTDNVHMGGYKQNLEDIDKRGGLKVGGNIDVYSERGSIAITTDTSAKNIKLESKRLNIITDGQTNITADKYELKANHYIGGLDTQDKVIDTMEGYVPIAPDKVTYLNVEKGDVSIDTGDKGYAFVRSNGDMNVTHVNAYKARLASGKNIKIGEDAKATLISVDGETDTLEVALPSRNYELKYIDRKSSKETFIKGDTAITYELANAPGGLNDGTHTATNTHLVAPDKTPVVPPVEPPVEPEPTPGPSVTDDNENVKILRNLEKNPIAQAIDAQEVYTPVAFAADLDDEIDTGVRKNVDGSVTVVRAFTPSN